MQIWIYICSWVFKTTHCVPFLGLKFSCVCYSGNKSSLLSHRVAKGFFFLFSCFLLYISHGFSHASSLCLCWSMLFHLQVDAYIFAQAFMVLSDFSTLVISWFSLITTQNCPICYCWIWYTFLYSPHSLLYQITIFLFFYFWLSAYILVYAMHTVIKSYPWCFTWYNHCLRGGKEYSRTGCCRLLAVVLWNLS